ncbi:MAG: acyl-ACP desaturase, partial [Nanoarchaeota archaeon]|nr:acyl-ACP desaturase [Nanoarchaeota archaeon]
LRYWVADEKKHGITLKQMIFLSKYLDIREVEDSEQNLLANGFDAGIGQDPFKLIFYTGFQEPATQISHINTAKLARVEGSEVLYEVCVRIAADEARHTSFYQGVAEKLFELDPDNAMTAYAYQMRKGISMPAQNMTSKHHEPLFDKFENIARRLKIYTAQDYAALAQRTNRRYRIETAPVTTDEAKRAQDFLSALPQKLLRLAPRLDERTEPFNPKHFPWIRSS